MSMIKSSLNSKSFSIRKLTIVGILGAISAVLGLTPIGFIPVGPTNATIMHIPVIIGAIVEGPIVGMLVGLIFGVFSMIRAITAPTVISPVFYNPLVSILPRVLVGLTAYYSFVLFKKLGRKTSLIMLISIWLLTLIYLSKTFITQFTQYNIGESVPLWRLGFGGLLVALTLFIGYFSYKRFKDQAVEVVLSAAVGTLTPPMGTVMFTTCSITGVKIADYVKESWPFYIVLVTCLLLITYIPQISLFLPNLF